MLDLDAWMLFVVNHFDAPTYKHIIKKVSQIANGGGNRRVRSLFGIYMCETLSARALRAAPRRWCRIIAALSSSCLQVLGDPHTHNSTRVARGNIGHVKIRAKCTRTDAPGAQGAGATQRDSKKSRECRERERRHTAKRECEVLSSALKHLAKRPAAPTAKANARRQRELSARCIHHW